MDSVSPVCEICGGGWFHQSPNYDAVCRAANDFAVLLIIENIYINFNFTSSLQLVWLGCVNRELFVHYSHCNSNGGDQKNSHLLKLLYCTQMFEVGEEIDFGW